jgi:hypothetical protein
VSVQGRAKCQFPHVSGRRAISTGRFLSTCVLSKSYSHVRECRHREGTAARSTRGRLSDRVGFCEALGARKATGTAWSARQAACECSRRSPKGPRSCRSHFGAYPPGLEKETIAGLCSQSRCGAHSPRRGDQSLHSDSQPERKGKHSSPWCTSAQGTWGERRRVTGRSHEMAASIMSNTSPSTAASNFRANRLLVLMNRLKSFFPRMAG